MWRATFPMRALIGNEARLIPNEAVKIRKTRSEFQLPTFGGFPGFRRVPGFIGSVRGVRFEVLVRTGRGTRLK